LIAEDIAKGLQELDKAQAEELSRSDAEFDAKADKAGAEAGAQSVEKFNKEKTAKKAELQNKSDADLKAVLEGINKEAFAEEAKQDAAAYKQYLADVQTADAQIDKDHAGDAKPALTDAQTRNARDL